MNWKNPFYVRNEAEIKLASEPEVAAVEDTPVDLTEALHQALSRTPAAPAEPKLMPSLIQPVITRGEPVEHPHTPLEDVKKVDGEIMLSGAVRKDN